MNGRDSGTKTVLKVIFLGDFRVISTATTRSKQTSIVPRIDARHIQGRIGGDRGGGGETAQSLPLGVRRRNVTSTVCLLFLLPKMWWLLFFQLRKLREKTKTRQVRPSKTYIGPIYWTNAVYYWFIGPEAHTLLTKCTAFYDKNKSGLNPALAERISLAKQLVWNERGVREQRASAEFARWSSDAGSRDDRCAKLRAVRAECGI